MKENLYIQATYEQNGFGLMEVIIVIALTGLVVLVVTSFSGNLGVLQNLVSQQLQSRSDIDEAIQIMTTEIRSAGPSGLGAYPVDSASTSSFAFYSDINKNGTFEHVRYFLGTSTIQKGVITPLGNPLVYATSTEVITTAVNNLTYTSTTPLFAYYGPAYTGSGPSLTSTDVTQVRIVQITFYADVNPGKAPQPLFFSDTVDLRNLRSN